jgi:pimeloyl-ACP methyl ester carboxylesterase
MADHTTPVVPPARPAVQLTERFPLPPGSHEGRLTANGIELHYVAAGDGPLVLLLHGFPQFWYAWRRQLPALAQRFRVVALDLRGYNLSERPAHGYDIVTLSEDIRAAVAALGAQQAALVGHDWGGVVAWATAIRAPECVSRLAVLNAPHPAVALHSRSLTQMRRSGYIPFFQLRGLAERALARHDFDAVRRTFRVDDPAGAWLSDTDIDRYIAALSRPGALPSALAYYRALPRPNNYFTLSPMRILQMPTLVLWGELDRYLGVSLLDGTDRWAHDLRVRRFPTASHWLNEQEPDQVNGELLAFLEEQ